MASVPQVKNRAPAAIQITAEQLLREAKERGLEDVQKAPKQFITDKEELLQYQQNKRKDFENQIRRQRNHIGTWCKYGLWEASQKDFERARSVFERALDVDYRNQTIWFKYVEMEMKNKFMNHARNILDRCVALHPRVDKFWFKYTYVEEMVGAVEQARQVFERWMKWEPEDMGWSAYIKFEVRNNEIDRARGIFERYVVCHPTSRAYLKYAKWEETMGQKARSRGIYERSFEEIHPDQDSEKLLISFARFEERCKEFDRARVIYQYAIDNMAGAAGATEAVVTAEKLTELKQEFIAFEKRHGSRKGIEDAIVKKRREQYEVAVAKDAYDYDSWFDYIRLEESEGAFDRIRAVYERAITLVPPLLEKRFWQRYIYLWINYALFEELQAKDVERTRDVYRRCLKVLPHKHFTFGKMWVLAANLEVRQKDMTAARKILGRGIGSCAKENIFKQYIQLELQLGEIDRCRALYGKYLETMPYNCGAWQAFAQLEINVGEVARARSIFEIAVAQPELDMPEMLWKAYIDFELNEREVDRVRDLYSRLLERTSHVKVWISFGKFEAGEAELVARELLEEGTTGHVVGSEEALEPLIRPAREIFSRGYAVLKSQGMKEPRLLLLEAWRDAEEQMSTLLRERAAVCTVPVDISKRVDGDTAAVDAMMPRKVKMRRAVLADDGTETGAMEEFYDYIFPDDESKKGSLKILEKAMLWKQKLQAANAGADSIVAGGEEGVVHAAVGEKRSASAMEDDSAIDIDDV